MRRQILILNFKILKHKFVGLFLRVSYWVLFPFALIYGIIIGFYGASKGMTKDEIMEQYAEKHLKVIRKLTKTE